MSRTRRHFTAEQKAQIAPKRPGQGIRRPGSHRGSSWPSPPAVFQLYIKPINEALEMTEPGKF